MITKASHPNQTAGNPEQEDEVDTSKSEASPDDGTKQQAGLAAETPDEMAANAVDPPDHSGALPEDRPGAESDEVERDPMVELQALHQQLAESEDRYLRAKAEVDNIRKRADTEVANARKFALEGFIREILTVHDSLEMAQAVDQQSEGGTPGTDLAEGVALILKQLDTVFDRFQVEMVEAVRGEKLDPDRHQAMSIQETDDVPPNCINQVVQKGYLLNNRLLRPAMVIVAKMPEKSSENA